MTCTAVPAKSLLAGVIYGHFGLVQGGGVGPIQDANFSAVCATNSSQNWSENNKNPEQRRSLRPHLVISDKLLTVERFEPGLVLDVCQVHAAVPLLSLVLIGLDF